MRRASCLLWVVVLLAATAPAPAVTPDTAKPEAAKPDAAKPAAAKRPTAKPATTKGQTAKPRSGKPPAVTTPAAKPEVVKLETAPEVFESPLRPAEMNQIDKLVFARLSSLGMRPVLCSDAVFVRRAYLDVIGTLPTAKEAREFIHDPDTKNKRRRLIDRLLERDEFADYWAMKWGDILRIKAEFPVNLWPNAAQAYHRWVRASIAENKPYDKFARELLTSSGSNFRVGPVNFYRAIQNRTPEGIAAAVALTFMGSRVDAWPKDRLPGMAVFFSQIGYKPTREWKEEHVFWDPLHAVQRQPSGSTRRPSRARQRPRREGPRARLGTRRLLSRTCRSDRRAVARSADVLTAVFPDGTKVQLSPDRDPREVFADWLITPKNPWFTRSIANRVWAWLLGRGIIHEPDDIRDDNPPSNPALLAYLEKELVASHYDLKHLYRLILNSSTYQLSSVPRYKGPQAEANFASYPLRRLDAEVLIDAINKITGTTDLYTSPIPEPFTYIPAGQAGDRDCRRQHHQPVPDAVRPLGAGHGHGERAQQQAGPRPVAAHAEFEPYPAQARPGPEAESDRRVGPQTAGDRGGTVSDDPFPSADGGGVEDGLGVGPQPGPAPGGGRRRLGLDQQSRVSLSALILSVGWAE